VTADRNAEFKEHSALNTVTAGNSLLVHYKCLQQRLIGVGLSNINSAMM